MKLKFKKHYIKLHTYEKIRYNKDRNLILKYGLKNKKEIGKYLYLVKKYRFIQVQKDENIIDDLSYKTVLSKLNKNNILKENESILDLTIDSFLKRRLQTIVYDLGLSKTLMHARQMITHKHILVNNEICIRPSRIINNYDIISINIKR